MELPTFRRKEIEWYDPDVVDLGNEELNRLWNTNADSTNESETEDRSFTDVFNNVVADFLDEIDPDQQMEEQYMKINDEHFQFTYSRYLLRKHYKEYSSCSAPISSDGKSGYVSPATHLKKTLFKIASNTKEYKERAAEIEAKLE